MGRPDHLLRSKAGLGIPKPKLMTTISCCACSTLQMGKLRFQQHNGLPEAAQQIRGRAWPWARVEQTILARPS